MDQRRQENQFVLIYLVAFMGFAAFAPNVGLQAMASAVAAGLALKLFENQ